MPNEITDLQKCFGCEACVNACPVGCIAFQQDDEGFFVPQIDAEKCIDCNKCRKICPANSAAEFHDVRHVFAAWSLDESIRCSSSSGGLYSVFANHVIDGGGVANGVKFDSNTILYHGLFETRDDIQSCRGSKYVQSRPGMIYKQVKDALDTGKKVLFTSTPCQVDALYRFLGNDHPNLITCDLICHGVPSPEFLKKTIAVINHDKNEISEITFRNLSKWGGCGVFINGNRQRNVADELYINTFLKGYSYRESCYNCPYATEKRVSDFTLGDFWGLGEYRAFKHDKSKGVSLLLINSKKGNDFFEEIKKDLFFEKRAFSEAVRENHQLKSPVKRHPLRDCFYFDMKNMAADDAMKKYCSAHGLVNKLIRFPFRVTIKIGKKTLRISNLMDRI